MLRKDFKFPSLFQQNFDKDNAVENPFKKSVGDFLEHAKTQIGAQSSILLDSVKSKLARESVPSDSLDSSNVPERISGLFNQAKDFLSESLPNGVGMTSSSEQPSSQYHRIETQEIVWEEKKFQK